MQQLNLLLLEQVRALIQEHGVKPVQEAVEFVARLRGAPEASREDKYRLAQLCSTLGVSYARDVFNPFMCVRALVKAGAPAKVCIEILERLINYRPAHPWAWLNRFMRQDYPAMAWGRHAPGELALEPALTVEGAPPLDDDAR